jgi:hypothetical protein
MRALSALVHLAVITANAIPVSMLAAQASTDDIYAPKTVLKAASDCGLPSDTVTSEYVDDLQSDVFKVAVGSDGQYRSAAICLAYWNSGIGNMIEFDDVEVRARQHEADSHRSKMLARWSSDSWLSGAKLSEKKRAFDPKKETINQFLIYIEKTCKSEPNTMLTTRFEGMVTFVPEWFGNPNDDDFTWSFGCASALMSFAELEKHGLSFGFVGNEAVRDK